MAVQYFTKSTSLLTDNGDLVFFGGVNDRISFTYACFNNTIVADGVNQTLVMGRANHNTIFDQSHGGLTLEFFAPALNETVYGFQNDHAGRVSFGAAPQGMTYAPDHHGGILATGGGISVDFIGFQSVAQLEARVKPF